MRTPISFMKVIQATDPSTALGLNIGIEHKLRGASMDVIPRYWAVQILNIFAVQAVLD